MQTLAQYLNSLDSIIPSDRQMKWFSRLEEQVSAGYSLFKNSSMDHRERLRIEFDNWVRTEEIKAWYGEPEGDSLFQGTSITSLTIPAGFEKPLQIKNISDLENEIADSYIRLHDQHKDAVINASLENVDKWISEGIFYGVVIASKVISQSFDLTVPHRDIIFEVDGIEVDPHEILSYSSEIRERYFSICKKNIACFKDLAITQQEFEESLVLSDISKPKIEKYSGKLILGPIRCNEICAAMSNNITSLIRKKTDGRISPRSLMVSIYDSDTPYTYHKLAGWNGQQLAPTLPGITLLGSSGSISAFRWTYLYRSALIAQKIMKSSLYSETKGRFFPFVFFGVLVERDANILLDLDELGLLRYNGNISPAIEYSYIIPKLNYYISEAKEIQSVDEILRGRIKREHR